ncbi:inositol monophosphatase, partial [candidate division WOR-3 bacterium]|nr:inositol monophosphatase [candidate division WOR-3 bacterium]
IRNSFRTLKEEEIEKKGFSHYVTRTDKEAEDILVRGLQGKFPDIGIYAEEGSEIKGRGRFLIDPLDGTHNFMHGIPHFCTSVAYELDSNIELGIIYDPMRDELFTAEKGKGAYLNGSPIYPSMVEKPERALISVGFPPTAYHLREEFMDCLKELIMEINSLRWLGSAALHLAYIADGRIDGDIEFGLSPWDVAAGWLIVKEAGGVITDERGGDEILKGNIIASTPALHPFLLDFFKRKMFNRKRRQV